MYPECPKLTICEYQVTYECDVSCLSPVPMHYDNLKRSENSGCVGGKPSFVGFLKIVSIFLSYKSYFLDFKLLPYSECCMLSSE